MLAGRNCGDKAKAGKSYMCLASSGTEGIMNGLMRWRCGRRWVLRQQRRQEGHSYAVGAWRRQRTAVGIIGLLFTLVATAASGQELSQPLTLTPLPSSDQESSQRLTLTPLLSLGERYDDNIFETQTNKQHDFITVLSPGIRVRYLPPAPTLETQLDFNYRAAIEFYADHSSQNNVGHLLSLTLASPLAPSLQVNMRELLLITNNPLARNQRLSDPTGFRPASQQTSERTLHNEAEGKVDIRLGGRTSLGVLFGNLIDNVDIPQELDEFRYRVGTDLGYLIDVARNSRVFVGYQVTFESFSANGTPPPGLSDAAFQVHTIGTGVRHELTPTLAVDAGLGYNFTTSDDPQKDGHNGFAMNAMLTKTFHNGQASLGYVRRFSAVGSTGSVTNEDTVSVAASINLTGKLTARFDSNVTWSNPQSVPGILNADNSDQRFSSIRPGLTYQILRPWSVSMAYAYEYTDYTSSSFANLSNHRLLLSTQYALREWLVLGLFYGYRAQHAHGNISQGAQTGVNDFTNNQVMLTVTASPALRF